MIPADGITPSAVRFEPMLEADLDAVLVIERSTFAEDAWSRGMFLRELKIPFAVCLVVRAQPPATAILGYVCWRELGDEWEILNVAVSPDARRRGLGAVLVKKVLQAAVEKAAAKVHLEVREDNVAAVSLYLRCEFFRSGLRRHYYGRDRHAVLMTWSQQRENLEEGNVDKKKRPD